MGWFWFRRSTIPWIAWRPSREVVGIHCLDLVLGLGTLVVAKAGSANVVTGSNFRAWKIAKAPTPSRSRFSNVLKIRILFPSRDREGVGVRFFDLDLFTGSRLEFSRRRVE